MFDPAANSFLERFCFQSGEHAAHCVVRRHTERQVEEPPEPVDISTWEPFDVSPGVRPADCAAQHRCDEVEQQMVLPAVLPRV